MALLWSRLSPEGAHALRIAAIYALIGCLWMLLSSGILALFMSRDVSLRDLPWNGIISGILVVLSSSFLLYLLVKKTLEDAHRAQQALKLRDRAIESSTNAIMITGRTLADQPIEYVNPAFTRITGYPAAEVLGRNWSFLLGAESDQPELEGVRAALSENREIHALLRSYRKDGSLFWNDLHLAPVEGDGGVATHFIGILNDVTEARNYQAELEHQANHDTLTGLPNRNLLQDRLAQAIAYAQRYQLRLAVVFIDLDNFKLVNDSLGHQAGDQLLKFVAERLQSCVRESDTLARLGGDEFILLMSDHSGAKSVDRATVSAKLQQILEEIARPYWIGAREFFVSCSIGYTLLPDDGDTADTLLRNADMAMYSAKGLGRNNIQPFLPELNAKVAQRLSLEGDLRHALEKGQFFLCYQPQLDLVTRRLVGMEALIRWQHPERGVISPVQFISLAEETGLIVPIGDWVMRTACAQAKAWQEEGLAAVRMSVNLSARQFIQRDLIASIKQNLHESGLSAEYLELELTESLLMHGAERFVATLHEIRALGVELAVDDFGTGYSSLSYLQRFPINRLKIDQSFVREIGGIAGSGAISVAIIRLAQSLDLKVIAEGVETIEQLDFLHASGCDEIQGYYFSHPLPVHEMRALLGRDEHALP